MSSPVTWPLLQGLPPNPISALLNNTVAVHLWSAILLARASTDPRHVAGDSAAEMANPGVSFTALLCLAIAAISRMAGPGRCSDHERFKDAVVRLFPRDGGAFSGITPDDAASDLYKFGRNPLIHAAGMRPSGPRRVRIHWFPSEQRIADMEARIAQFRPVCRVFHCFDDDPQQTVIDAQNMAPGVAEMIRRFSGDDAAVRAAIASLNNGGWDK